MKQKVFGGAWHFLEQGEGSKSQCAGGTTECTKYMLKVLKVFKQFLVAM